MVYQVDDDAIAVLVLVPRPCFRQGEKIADACLTQAERAVASSKLLLEAGDADGACSRACCTMFDAARGAIATGMEPDRTGTAGSARR